MHKLILLALSLSLLRCEKPAPQSPKVVSTYTYHDSIKSDIAPIAIKDTIKTIPHKKDSLELPNIDSSNQNYITYTNAADRIVHIAYNDNNDIRQVDVKFPEQSLYTNLEENTRGSNVYMKNNIKWETNDNRRLGKLTISGTWFEFIKKD